MPKTMNASTLGKKKSVVFADKPIILNIDELKANGEMLDDDDYYY